MTEANFRQVFIGIESPRKKSLAETRKVQNIRGDSLEAKIQRLRDGGLVVVAGFIVGFDNDDESIFEEQADFIHRTGLAQAMLNPLTPVPTTPLYARLKAEGRLDYSDPLVVFKPKLMSRETLKQGYIELMLRLYEPEAYFERLYKGYRESPAFRRRRQEMDRLQGRPGFNKRLLGIAGGLIQATKLARVLKREGLLRRLGRAYLGVWFGHNRAMGRDALPFGMVVNMCAVHWHFYKMAQVSRQSGIGIGVEARRQWLPVPADAADVAVPAHRSAA
jgi:radical SAM superfamily enzyme YgiQ (UPF0313 family)